MGDSAGYIYSDQMVLCGHREVVGFTNGRASVLIMDRAKANEVIVANHYSHKTYAATTLHFGYYEGGALLGVLQYGFAMNPASQASVVRGTKIDEYLELNRMWISDSAMAQAESQAISMTVKVIRNIRPKVQWIQSFADERCGKFGAVYQACSFDYYGEHRTDFYELDGVVYHKSLAERNPDLTPSARYLQDNIDRATKSSYRQFRYIKWIDKRAKARCLLVRQPYPKPDGGCVA